VSRQGNLPGAEFFAATLRGPRLVLLAYDEDRDFDNIVLLYSDPVVTDAPGIAFPSPFLDRLRLLKRARMARSDAGEWTAHMQIGDTDFLAGEFGIVEWNDETRVVELFCVVHGVFKGKAYGREGVSALMTHIYGRDPLAAVRMQVLSSNERSMGLCCALGFKETGSRFVQADPVSGFRGGMAAIMDCRAWEFRAFQLKPEGHPHL
jgi:RimJ/RimL family protein N-acetyltransferase